MTKCNILGRGEARYSKQLEKAKEKIINLKVLLDAYNLIGKVFLWPLDCQLCGHCQERIQELETSAELKDNAILRSLKVSNITGCLKNPESNSSYNSDLLSADKISAKELGKQILTPHSRMNLSVNNNNEVLRSAKIQNIDVKESRENKNMNFSKESSTRMSLDWEENYISLDEDDSELTPSWPGFAKNNCKDQGRDIVSLRKPTVAKPEAAFSVERKTAMQEHNLVEPPRVDVNDELGKNASGALSEDVTLDNVKQVQPIINIRKENPSSRSLSGSGMLLVVKRVLF